MANGGFAYASALVTYHSADFATNYAWALALHKTRVKAFLQATYRAYQLSDGALYSSSWWQSIRLGDDSSRTDIEFECPVDPSGEVATTMTIYIQDVNGSAQTNYPAFVTVFENPDSYTQFAIITSRGYHNKSSFIGDATKGFYIPLAKCLSNGNNRLLPYTFAHAFAANGFGSLSDGTGELDNGTLNPRELPICPSYGLASYTGTSDTSSSGQASIITAPTEGVTYHVGYAVKGVSIEGFWKSSAYPVNTGACWDLSGAIFDGDLGWDADDTLFTGTPFGYYALGLSVKDNAARSLSDTVPFFNSAASVDALNSSAESYAQTVLASGASVNCKPACSPGYLPMRSSSTVSGELTWSSGCVAWTAGASYDAVRNLPSIDGNGNSCAGFLRDDVFRFVSIFATRQGGTTYQGGNFIAMNCGQNNDFELGVLLGWDGSNTNDIL